MKKKKIFKRISIVCALIIIIGAGIFFTREFISNCFVKFNLNSISEPDKSSRVLIFAPHNDDEALGASEFINKTLKNGGKVKVVLITNGDGFKNAIQLDYLDVNPKSEDYIKFGYTRQKESIAALKKLGLPQKDIIFLGYPDGGISYMWKSNWENSNPYTSKYTKKNNTPYNNSFTSSAIYSGQSLQNDIEKIIEDYKPTIIVMPHPNDRHPDHWATNAFVKYTLAKINYVPKKQLLYLVHRGDWPTPMKQDTKLFLVPPKKLINIGTKWEALDLDEEEIKQKGEVISTYKTQFKTLKILITAFQRKNELFGEYPDAILSKFKDDDTHIKPDNSNIIILDPLQDSLDLTISKGADISAIYAELSKENNFHVFLKTNDEIEKMTKYSVNLIFFNKKDISRVSLETENGRLTVKGLKYINKDKIKLQINNNCIHIIVPKKYIGDFNNVFINGTSSIKNHQLDKTAWRMVR